MTIFEQHYIKVYYINDKLRQYYIEVYYINDKL